MEKCLVVPRTFKDIFLCQRFGQEISNELIYIICRKISMKYAIPIRGSGVNCTVDGGNVVSG